ncbi:MAG: rhomboid family intramembrane serine protease, partial [Candidatus Aenigmatarchaeota archaeon]
MKAQFFPYKDENPSRSFPIVMILLIIVNFVIFAWSLTDFDNIISTYGFTPIYFSFFTILTSMFLHGGIGHIAGNMWYLWLFGDNVEDRFGKIKFLIFYICAGFFAAFVHYISDPFSEIPAIGASGAISGVLGAYMAIFPSVRVKTIGPFYQIFEIPAWALIGFWFVLQLFSGIFTIIGGLGGGGIAFWAHIGG